MLLRTEEPRCRLCARGCVSETLRVLFMAVKENVRVHVWCASVCAVCAEWQVLWVTGQQGVCVHMGVSLRFLARHSVSKFSPFISAYFCQHTP